MAFEYRQFSQAGTQNKWQLFTKINLIDLYFFKKNCAGVGIKARNPIRTEHGYLVKQIEIKILSSKKSQKAKQEKQMQWQYWKNKKYFNVEFTILSRQGLQLSKSSEQQTQLVLKTNLRNINRCIIQALIANIKEKSIDESQSLRYWIDYDNQLLQIYEVKKQKMKSKRQQSGLCQITPLYYFDSKFKSKHIYTFFAYQSSDKQKLLKKLQKDSIKISANYSYPKLLQKIYSSSKQIKE